MTMRLALPIARAALAQPGLRRKLAFGASVLALSQIAVLALAGEGLRVSQKGRAFNLKEVTVAKGEIVHFGNDDEFIHQIYVQSSSFNFDSEESSPGDTIDLKFTEPGTYEVHCHIHPKMLLVVTVK